MLTKDTCIADAIVSADDLANNPIFLKKVQNAVDAYEDRRDSWRQIKNHGAKNTGELFLSISKQSIFAEMQHRMDQTNVDDEMQGSLRFTH